MFLAPVTHTSPKSPLQRLSEYLLGTFVVRQHSGVGIMENRAVPTLQFLVTQELQTVIRERLKRSARPVQLFGCLAVAETHSLWYFGHHCCLVVGFDALGIWHFWIFTLFHPFLPFCTLFLPIYTTPTLFLG